MDTFIKRDRTAGAGSKGRGVTGAGEAGEKKQ